MRKTYTLYGAGDEILATGRNKAELIKRANRTQAPATVEEDGTGIIYENRAQRAINNGR